MKNKGPRANVVTDFAIDYLDEYRFTTKTNYGNYAKEVAANRTSRLQQLISIMASLDKQILDKQRNYDHAKKIVADENSSLRTHYINDLDKYQTDINQLRKEYRLAKAEETKLKTVIPTYEKYLELFDNVADLLRRTTSIAMMDKILGKFFSNIILKAEFYGPKKVNTGWEVVEHKLKEPYAGFLQKQDFERGRDLHTLLELFKYITENPEPSERLLEQLRATKPPKQTAMIGLVL